MPDRGGTDSRRPPTVSAVLITRNEAARIGRCLASLRWADEIVVVDAESDDGTAELAAAAGARVVTRPWPGDFADQRNFADQQARGDWCFSVDPDEEVTPALVEEVRRLVADPGPYVGFSFRRRERIFGRWIEGGGWGTQRKLRLYRRGAGRWVGVVHERMVLDGPVGLAREPLLHDSYPTVAAFVEKYNRYTTMEAEAAFRGGRRFSWWALFLTPLERAFGRYVLHGGFRDGAHGLVLALLIGLGYVLRALKLWELEERARAGAPELPAVGAAAGVGPGAPPVGAAGSG
ncbi:MAG TPA: glycosyltransferase family 2 protein, partial [Thermodesulfobacteriota bacterium]|nr:glycosyltransferase family 2 protein [Thermodesulfobacteriota bacterium]